VFHLLQPPWDIDQRGRLVANEAGKRAIGAFWPEVTPEPDQEEGHLAFFPAPPDTTWSQVKIRLLDGHAASVLIGTARGVYTHAQMGMAPRRAPVRSIRPSPSPKGRKGIARPGRGAARASRD